MSDGPIIGQARLGCSVRVHDEDLRTAVHEVHERDLRPVGRPARRRPLRESYLTGSVWVDPVDPRAAVPVAGERDTGLEDPRECRARREHLWRRRCVALTSLLDGDGPEAERHRPGATHGTSLKMRVDRGAAPRVIPSGTSRAPGACAACATSFTL